MVKIQTDHVIEQLLLTIPKGNLLNSNWLLWHTDKRPAMTSIAPLANGFSCSSQLQKGKISWIGLFIGTEMEDLLCPGLTWKPCKFGTWLFWKNDEVLKIILRIISKRSFMIYFQSKQTTMACILIVSFRNLMNWILGLAHADEKPVLTVYQYPQMWDWTLQLNRINEVKGPFRFTGHSWL